MNHVGRGQKSHGNLTLYIIISIVLAIATALILPLLMGVENEATTLSIFEGIGIGGEVFLRALMMMVVPLVVASVMNGILGLGDVRKLGKPGFTAIGYYFATTILAVTIGLVTVNIFNPGAAKEVRRLPLRRISKRAMNRRELMVKRLSLHRTK